MRRKGLKKLFVILTVLCFMVTTLVPAFAVEFITFSDVPTSHWAYQSVMNMVRLEVISGYPDGTFKPDKYVSREEFAKMLCGATSIPLANPRHNTYADIPTDHWAFRYVETVKTYLTNESSPSGSKPLFKGKLDATREDIAVALVKIKGFDKTVAANPNIIEDMFKDTYTISSHLKNLMAIAVEKKLIEGFPDNTIRGTDPLTRAQAATIIDRANKIAGDIKNTGAYQNNSSETNNDLLYLTVDSNKTVGKVGHKLQASAKGFFSDGGTKDITNEVKWSSSDGSILFVASNGEIFLRKEGTAKIIATMGDKTDSQEIAVISDKATNSNVLKLLRLSPPSKEIGKNQVCDFKAEAIYENGKIEDVTNSSNWEISDSNIAVIDSNGRMTAIKEGVALIKATYKNESGYAALSVTDSVYNPPANNVNIILKNITISHNYRELRVGQKTDVRVIANYSNCSKKDITASVQWTSENQKVAVITQEGQIVAVSQGVCKITATVDGKTSYMYVIIK